jgi:hypothetical protein
MDSVFDVAYGVLSDVDSVNSLLDAVQNILDVDVNITDISTGIMVTSFAYVGPRSSNMQLSKVSYSLGVQNQVISKAGLSVILLSGVLHSQSCPDR